MMIRKKAGAALTAALAMSLLAACGDDNAADETTDAGGETAATGEISIGVPAGWDEGVVVSHMAEIALEEQGYDVELVNGEIGVIFTGLSTGDMDLLLDAWLPVTHATYLEKYGDDIEELGTWYEEAKLALTVNGDAPIQSIDELADSADEFNNEIIGIDGGAGITRITQEEVIPTYGLEGMDFKISSTAAMLAELEGAMNEGRNIVVTLWSPHWAYGAYDIRDLEDPEGAYGAAEDIKSFGRSGFMDDYPEVAEVLSNFTLSDEELSDLENYALNENADRDTAETVGEWLDENPDVKDRFTIDAN
ncbi:glycine betaine ABC transporter substrate-binding protein [Flaviflexus salsibiostraticola]|uniref:Glycine betaine ABC transporter substrate-binding protein n=1 Tax=Flaviflexus salsibiostraticola TaxID=1282737 RepID=A0A3S8ZA83_9ACTO|nr:glycine betaine ABC transporter substrate-binding protein [Flaviflexus salsibiostraticola]AZN30374.1 glycine betaine ABC transporter substrate-binding protein [Flaviflexus salsibiostraticola]